MLGKLIKYDLLFGMKRYFVIFLLIAGTWITGLIVSCINIDTLSSMYIAMNLLLTVLLFGAYFITSLQFFYNSLSSGESYFNYTIPVKPFSLVISKLLVIWMWGAVLTGAIILTWLSLFKTMLTPMGVAFEMPREYTSMLVIMAVTQVIMQSCLLAFAISILNVPRMKTSGSGIVLVAIIAYAMTQVVGFIQLGIYALVQFIREPEVLKGMFSDSLIPSQEIELLKTMQYSIGISSMVFAVIFVALTVRTIEKRRSV